MTCHHASQTTQCRSGAEPARAPRPSVGRIGGIAVSPGDRPASRIVACDNCGKHNRVPDAATGVPTSASCSPAAALGGRRRRRQVNAAVDTKLAVLVEICGRRGAVRVERSVPPSKRSADAWPGASRRSRSTSTKHHGRTPARRAGEPHLGGVAPRPRGGPPGRRPTPRRNSNGGSPTTSTATPTPTRRVVGRSRAARGRWVPVALVGDGVAIAPASPPKRGRMSTSTRPPRPRPCPPSRPG